ncbi:hypothetical protein WME76_26355 [Sorangium sp. So ce119]
MADRAYHGAAPAPTAQARRAGRSGLGRQRTLPALPERSPKESHDA